MDALAAEPRDSFLRRNVLDMKELFGEMKDAIEPKRCSLRLGPSFALSGGSLPS
jgi:hypothetical protein